MESVTVKAAGRASTVTAAAALRHACQRMALSAVAGEGVSATNASAPYQEHLETSVRSVQHVETLAALQGESTFTPPLEKKKM